MDYIFQLNTTRTVLEANYNTYITPFLHPDRTMQLHDFLYILEGSWEIALESNGKCDTYPMGQGDILILPAGLHHYGAKPCSPNARNMYLHTAPAPGDRISGSPGERENEAESSFVLLSPFTHCGGNLKISGLFTDIISVCWGNSSYKAGKLSCLFNLLLYEIHEQQQKSPATLQCASFVENVTQFLQANPQTFFSVPAIADKFHVSMRTLNNRFANVYGRSFYSWQMEHKLEMAYQFLRNNPDITLKETAANFGFYDEFHLSRAFKKHFGIAPKYVR